MERLRITIDPSMFPGKPVDEIRNMVTMAEVTIAAGVDPIGANVGSVMLLVPAPSPVKLLED